MVNSGLKGVTYALVSSIKLYVKFIQTFMAENNKFSTPVTTQSQSKRTRSDNSTPSPSIAVSQLPKKAKMPETDSNTDSNTNSIIQTVLEAVKSTIAEQVTISVTAMANSVAQIVTTSLNERLNALESENQELKDQVKTLTARVNDLETHKISFNHLLDTAEQYSRRACLRIAGVPESMEESTDSIVLDIAKACGVDLTLSDIDRSHRVRSRNSADNKKQTADIIVKFVSYRSRAAFLSTKRDLKKTEKYKSVFINEDLTRHRANLLRVARSHVKSNALKSAWSYDGRIYIRYPDDSRRLIHSMDDLGGLQ